jgi:alpha-1,3/alpha-1,6-mannosyltransferase
VHEQTGYLAESDPAEFAKFAARIIRNKEGEKMGDMGRKRIDQRFSFDAFSSKLNEFVMNLCDKKRK